jgi:hypothetical protein
MAKSRNNKRNIALADYSPWVLTVDYFLRWLSLGAYRALYKGQPEGQLGVFILFQILIGFFTVGYALYREHRYRAALEKVKLDQASPAQVWQYMMQAFGRSVPYELIGSSFTVLLRVFFVLTFSYMLVSAYTDLGQIDWNDGRNNYQRTMVSIVFTCTAFAHGAFVFFISSLSVPAPRREEAAALDTVSLAATEPAAPEKLTDEAAPLAEELQKLPSVVTAVRVDLNDNRIIQLEGELKNLLNRVEAYILESVMFGALTFSGFLTLLASDENRLNYGDMQTFGFVFKTFLLELLVLELDINQLYDVMTTAQFLLISIMFLTLNSSMFFLFVIASRIKFTSVIEKVDNAIRLARAFNTKEEEVYVLHLQFENIPRFKQRLEYLGNKIDHQIKVAVALIAEVKPVVYYMSLFRNLGVLLFLVIIILSLLFFSSEIALVAALLVMGVFVYKRTDDWYRKRRLARIISRE